MKNEENKKDIKLEEENKPKKRRIVIETDGNNAKIVEAEVAGSLELKAILEGLFRNMK